MGYRSIHLLLLVNAEGARAHVDQQEKPAAIGVIRMSTNFDGFRRDLHDGKNLKKIVFGEVLVRVMFMQLLAEESAHRY